MTSHQLFGVVLLSIILHVHQLLLGDKYREYVLLEFLSQGGKFSYQKNFSWILNLSPSMVVKLLHSLESDGKITHVADLVDKRGNIYSLTEKGEYVFSWMVDQLKKYWDDVSSDFSEDDMVNIIQLLGKVLNNLPNSPDYLLEEMPAYGTDTEKFESIPQLVTELDQERLIEMMRRISNFNKQKK